MLLPFYWMIISAFGVTITTFVGQNFGAHKYDRMRKSIGTCPALLCQKNKLMR